MNPEETFPRRYASYRQSRTASSRLAPALRRRPFFPGDCRGPCEPDIADCTIRSGKGEANLVFVDRRVREGRTQLNGTPAAYIHWTPYHLYFSVSTPPDDHRKASTTTENLPPSRPAGPALAPKWLAGTIDYAPPHPGSTTPQPEPMSTPPPPGRRPTPHTGSALGSSPGTVESPRDQEVFHAFPRGIKGHG